jgi:hypothetical protein
VLRDHFDPLYPDFNTDYPDQLRADEFLNEFAAYVARATRTKALISNCHLLFFSICPTITPEARVPTCRAPPLPSPTTTSPSAAWSTPFRIALLG